MVARGRHRRQRSPAIRGRRVGEQVGLVGVAQPTHYIDLAVVDRHARRTARLRQVGQLRPAVGGDIVGVDAFDRRAGLEQAADQVDLAAQAGRAGVVDGSAGVVGQRGPLDRKSVV